MKRLLALILPALLLFPVGATAQGTPVENPPAPECIILGALLLGGDPTLCEDVSPLRAAKARWDAFAAQFGKRLTRQWLGPRPKTLDDIWWADDLTPLGLFFRA
jgi:hypothetical protein